MVDQVGVRFGLANGALVLTLLIAAALPLDLAETAAVALLAAGAVSASLPHRLALVMGCVSWAWFTGFFENRYGVLTLSPHDLLDLAGFLVAAVVLGHLLRAPLAIASGGSHE
jgi:hypothetical protein